MENLRTKNMLLHSNTDGVTGSFDIIFAYDFLPPANIGEVEAYCNETVVPF